MPILRSQIRRATCKEAHSFLWEEIEANCEEHSTSKKEKMNDNLILPITNSLSLERTDRSGSFPLELRFPLLFLLRLNSFNLSFLILCICVEVRGNFVLYRFIVMLFVGIVRTGVFNFVDLALLDYCASAALLGWNIANFICFAIMFFTKSADRILIFLGLRFWKLLFLQCYPISNSIIILRVFDSICCLLNLIQPPSLNLIIMILTVV